VLCLEKNKFASSKQVEKQASIELVEAHTVLVPNTRIFQSILMVFLSSPQKMTELFLHRVNPIYYSDYSDTLFSFHGRKPCFLS
jgi:hypothetical protein